MADIPKVTLTDEQWEYLKRHEDERTRNQIKHNAAIIEAMNRSIEMMAESMPQQNSLDDKRDWFAGQAMVGAWSQPPEAVRLEDGQTVDEAIRQHWDNVAKAAYTAADAFMAARKAGA